MNSPLDETCCLQKRMCGGLLLISETDGMLSAALQQNQAPTIESLYGGSELLRGKTSASDHFFLGLQEIDPSARATMASRNQVPSSTHLFSHKPLKGIAC